MTRARILLWTVPTAFYVLFCCWYTNLSGPLSDAEIAHYTGILARNGAVPERLAQMRRFMETDTGRQFIMLNVIDMARDPPPVAGVASGESADALLARYMEYMWSALLKRACHPVFVGDAVAPALDVSGIAGAEHWSRGALMRYRSRRDALEIATNPEFGGRHEFKMAALEKTIAFPVEPQLYLSDVRFLLLLLLLASVGVADAAIYRRRDTR